MSRPDVLRDARLRRALESAPDAHMQPDAKTRAAILAAARVTAAPAAVTRPWWRALWDSTGRKGPWNAAFASVLVASLVTLIWQGHEVPDKGTDTATVASAPQGTAAPSAPAAVPVPLPADPPAPARREPEAQPPPRKAAAPRPATQAPSSADAAADALAAATAEQASRRRQDAERREFAKAEPPPASVPLPAPAAAPAPAEVAPPVVAAAPAMQAAPPTVVAQAAPPAAAPMARSAPAAPAPAPAAAPPAPQLSDRGASAGSAMQSFDQGAAPVRLVLQERSVLVPGAQARRLLDLAQAVSRSAQGPEALAAPVTLRIEVPGPSAGVLEVAGPQVRWRGLTGRPDTAALQALEQEAARLAR